MTKTLYYTAEEGCEPTLGNAFAAGIDLRAKEQGIIHVGDTWKCGTGVRLEIPRGHVGIIRGRSGLAFKRDIWSFEGTIDEDYRGEVMILLMNVGQWQQTIEKGERVAQLIVLEKPEIAIQLKLRLDHREGGRGEDGFGSTGRR